MKSAHHVESTIHNIAGGPSLNHIGEES
jgi:hypothetical protein